MTETREDILIRVTRDRARAYARLAVAQGEIQDLRAELAQARLDLAAARELLAYHGLEVVSS